MSSAGRDGSLGVSLLVPMEEGKAAHSRPPLCSGRLRGYVLSLLAVLAVSPDAALLRFIRLHSHQATNCVHVDAATCNAHMLMVLIFLKYTTMGSIQLAFVVCESGGIAPLRAALRTSWKPLIVPSLFMLITQLGFTISLLETTAANAIMFFSLNPLWAALMGFFFLHDRVAKHTLIAMAIAAGAVVFAFLPVVMRGVLPHGWVQADAQPEGASEPTLHGNVIALATGASLAAFITGSRAGSLADANAPMSAAPAFGSLGAALVAAPFAIRWIHRLSDRAFLAFIFVDALLEAVYDVAMALAAEHITSAEVALVLLLEIPLGPLFVFLCFGETPPSFTLIGCVVLTAALVGHGVVEAGQEQESRSSQSIGSMSDRQSHAAMGAPHSISPAGSNPPSRGPSRPASFVAIATGPRRVYSFNENLYHFGASPQTSPYSARPAPLPLIEDPQA